jgi:hypothetical protein
MKADEVMNPATRIPTMLMVSHLVLAKGRMFDLDFFMAAPFDRD